MNNFNNNFEGNNDFLVVGQLERQNKLKQQELKEQQAMRKAYCKVNDIPYEEPQEIPSIGQGSLKVICLVMWLFIVGTIISAFIGEGNFLTNFMKVWF